MWALVVTATLLACPAPRAPADELERRLAGLSAPLAEERAAAERWLAGHLRAADYPELALAARAGDAEVRLRLARVLGGDERHLELALRFLIESEPALSAIGREAVHASIVTFDPHLGDPPLTGRDLEERLRELADGSVPRLYRLDPTRPLDASLRALASVADLPVGIVLDEGLAERALRRRGEALVGSWNELLLRLADQQGMVLTAHGGDGEKDSAPLFLRFASQGSGNAAPGVDLLQHWLEVVASPGEASRREWAARNLGASGFLPALGWLEARLRADADPAALQGLLVAAAGGRVAPALRDPGVLRGLLPGLAELQGERFAAFMRGLARVGCTATDGSAIATTLLADFAAADEKGRWARLFLCSELGCGDEAVARLARDTLAGASVPLHLRRRALALVTRLGVGVPEPSEAVRQALLATVVDDLDGERLALEFVAAGLEPLAPAPDASGSARRSVLVMHLLRRDAPAAAEHLRALVSGSGVTTDEMDATTAVLERLALAGERRLVLDVVTLARGVSDTAGLERVAILLGALPETELATLAARGREWLQAADPVLLGALAGTLPEPSELGSAARGLLLERASTLAGSKADASDPTLLAGLERALAGLMARRRDEQARAFSRAAQAALRSDARSELARAFTAGLERVPGVTVVDVEREGRTRFLPPGQ
jgi:hypothetical protein